MELPPGRDLLGLQQLVERVPVEARRGFVHFEDHVLTVGALTIVVAGELEAGQPRELARVTS
jgi:hypothetical protein